MDQLLSGLKTEVLWLNNNSSGDLTTDGLDGSSLIPVELGGTLLQPPKPIVSVMDLGKMLLHCAKDGDISKVHELMSRGAPFSTDWLGTSPLHMAAAHNHFETCEVLLRAGICKDARTKVDRTALHFAVFNGHLRIVDLLLSNKCEVNARDMLKMTPLHWAVQKKHKKIVQSLLKYQADPNAISKFFKTPLTIAVETNQTDILEELLMWKMKIGDREQQSAAEALVNEMKQDEEAEEKDVQYRNVTECSGYNVVDENYNDDVNDQKNSTMIDDFDDTMMISSEEESLSQNTVFSHSDFDGITKDLKANQPQNSLPHPTITSNAPTLQMLKDHGISMLTDDTENTLLNSALQNGRKLVLSDAGKLLLNDMKYKKIETSNTNIELPPSLTPLMPTTVQKSKPTIQLVSAKQLPAVKSNKGIIKILSANEFKQMYNVSSTLKKIPSDTFINAVRCHTLPGTSIGITKVTSTSTTNSNSIPLLNSFNQHNLIRDIKKSPTIGNFKLKYDPSTFQTATTTTTPPPMLTVKKEVVQPIMKPVQYQSKPLNKPTTIISGTPRLIFTQSFTRTLSTPPTTSKSSLNTTTMPISFTRIKHEPGVTGASSRPQLSTITPTSPAPAPVSSIPSLNANVAAVTSQDNHQPMMLSEIERQLLELKKQTEELRKQLELSQKQNDEYKVRLEKLEQEKQLEKDEKRYRMF